MKSVSLLILCVFLVVKVNSGTFDIFLYEGWIKCDHNRSLHGIDVSEVKVYFYDFQNGFNLTSPIHGAVNRLTTEHNLNMSRRLIFFVPGFDTPISDRTPDLVRQTFSSIPDIYVIIIDHSKYTNSKKGFQTGYERSVTFSYYIGKVLGNFLSGLHKKGYPSKNIHCIGHSLGGQMLAVTGTTYHKQTSQKIWKVTGLDPAGPCFAQSSRETQLRSGVAEYVEVYHCNAKGLGTASTLADTDFFFNKGISQPRCDDGWIPFLSEADAAKCSHSRCVTYYMYTVHHPNKYLAWKCDSFKSFYRGKCSGLEVTLAGYWNPANVTDGSVFYVSTELRNIVSRRKSLMFNSKKLNMDEMNEIEGTLCTIKRTDMRKT